MPLNSNFIKSNWHVGRLSEASGCAVGHIDFNVNECLAVNIILAILALPKIVGASFRKESFLV